MSKLRLTETKIPPPEGVSYESLARIHFRIKEIIPLHLNRGMVPYAYPYMEFSVDYAKKVLEFEKGVYQNNWHPLDYWRTIPLEAVAFKKTVKDLYVADKIPLREVISKFSELVDTEFPLDLFLSLDMFYRNFMYYVPYPSDTSIDISIDDVSVKYCKDPTHHNVMGILPMVYSNTKPASNTHRHRIYKSPGINRTYIPGIGYHHVLDTFIFNPLATPGYFVKNGEVGSVLDIYLPIPYNMIDKKYKPLDRFQTGSHYVAFTELSKYRRSRVQ